MKLSAHLQDAVFLARLNRFAAKVRLGEKEVLVHVANSGRLRELLIPGVRTLVEPMAGSGRKTGYDLALVDLGHTLVSADARLPNYLMREAIEECSLPMFSGYHGIRREVPYAESRLDLLLEGEGAPCYVEVKSVTLVEKGVGLFPDAPTERGRRHLQSLMKARKEGYRAVVAFVVQREDVLAFAPNEAADPAFAETLRLATESGVEAYAFKCAVSHTEIRIVGDVPVRLHG